MSHDGVLHGVYSRFFYWLSEHTKIKKICENHRPFKGIASRYVAGIGLPEVLTKAAELRKEGIKISIDHLGERVNTKKEATNEVKTYKTIITGMKKAKVPGNIVIKPSQLGIRIDRKSTLKNLKKLIELAKKQKTKVEIDAEHAFYQGDVIDTYLKLGRLKKYCVICIQANLRRSEHDIHELISQGASIRLVKGAYKEHSSLAYRRKWQVDREYERMISVLLGKDTLKHKAHAIIATHDDAMINHAIMIISKTRKLKKVVEFEFLYGARNGLARSIKDQGYKVRMYIPYGTHWYSYLCRRFAEHPGFFWFLFKRVFF